MDFQAALDCMKEGKAVARSDWEDTSYLIEDGHLWATTTTQDGNKVLMVKLDVEDILAGDWVALA